MTTAVAVSAIIAALSWFAYKALVTFLPTDAAKIAGIALIASTVVSFFIPLEYAGYLAIATALGTVGANASMARNYLRVKFGRPQAIRLAIQSILLLILAAIAYWLVTIA